MRDHMVRGLSRNMEVRAFAVSARDTVERARECHNSSPVVTAALGRLLSAGAMMGAMLQGEDKLTLLIRSDGPVEGLTVTADARGHVKGFPLESGVINEVRKSDGKLDVGGIVGHGTLKVIKDQGLKEPYTGEIDLVNGEIGDDLTYYFAKSEQIPSAVGLGVLMNKNNTVAEAGGFIVQILPGASEESISTIERNVAAISSVTGILKEGRGPEDLINTVMAGLDPEITESTEVSFECGCDREKVSKVLLSLGEKELKSLIGEGKDTEIKCQFCNTAYRFTVPEITEILSQSLSKSGG